MHHLVIFISFLISMTPAIASAEAPVQKFKSTLTALLAKNHTLSLHHDPLTTLEAAEKNWERIKPKIVFTNSAGSLHFDNTNPALSSVEVVLPFHDNDQTIVKITANWNKMKFERNYFEAVIHALFVVSSSETNDSNEESLSILHLLNEKYSHIKEQEQTVAPPPQQASAKNKYSDPCTDAQKTLVASSSYVNLGGYSIQITLLKDGSFFINSPNYQGYPIHSGPIVIKSFCKLVATALTGKWTKPKAKVCALGAPANTVITGNLGPNKKGEAGSPMAYSAFPMNTISSLLCY